MTLRNHLSQAAFALSKIPGIRECRYIGAATWERNTILYPGIAPTAHELVDRDEKNNLPFVSPTAVAGWTVG